MIKLYYYRFFYISLLFIIIQYPIFGTDIFILENEIKIINNKKIGLLKQKDYSYSKLQLLMLDKELKQKEIELYEKKMELFSEISDLETKIAINQSLIDISILKLKQYLKYITYLESNGSGKLVIQEQKIEHSIEESKLESLKSEIEFYQIKLLSYPNYDNSTFLFGGLNLLINLLYNDLVSISNQEKVLLEVERFPDWEVTNLRLQIENDLQTYRLKSVLLKLNLDEIIMKIDTHKNLITTTENKIEYLKTKKTALKKRHNSGGVSFQLVFENELELLDNQCNGQALL